MKSYFLLSLLSIPFFLLSQVGDHVKFEESLPAEDLIVLNELLQLYDSILTSSYLDYKPSPKELLTDISEGRSSRIKINKERACHLREKLNNSTLLEKSAQLKYKSIYTVTEYTKNGKTIKDSEGIIVSVNQENDTVYNEFLFLESYRPYTIKDKINLMKDDGYYKFYSISTFERGIRSIENNTLLSGYLEAKSQYNKMGMDYKKIANFVAHNPPADFDDYFMKRVIITELFVKYLDEFLKC